MAQIFLCYAREDEAQVRDLYERLRALGFELWMDKVNLVVGQKWALEIPKALQASSLVLVCLSQTSVTKIGYVQREFKLALDTLQEMPEGMIHTLPVRLDACDVPEQFYELHWCNLFEVDGFDRLIESIRIGLSQRQQEPIPPPEAPPTAESTTLQPYRELAEPVDVAPTASEPEVALSEANKQIVPPEERAPDFTNTIGMEFVLIPAGSFMMGSPDTDVEASPDERPAHCVMITQPFYLGKYEVTQGEWAAVMGNNPSHFKGDPNRPVENVSWHDVQRFMEKLNEREGGATYRLPTEAEWEYAARAGTKGTRYHKNIDEIAWYVENSTRETHAVGQKVPNAWGLYDMLGNVFEWVQDWYAKEYYQRSPACDPA